VQTQEGTRLLSEVEVVVMGAARLVVSP